MSLIRPFTGLRPAAGRASDVAAPPYDVLNTQEARAQVQGRPWSFLHISRPEVDLPEGTDAYAPEVYAKARENLDHMIAKGVLTRDEQPCFYVYRLTMGEHRQTGLVAAASIQAYDRNRIKKHEFTRPVKEDDRVRQVDTLNAQTGPVFLVYPSTAGIDAILAERASDTPEVDVTARDGVRHELWATRDAAINAELVAHFDALDALYVADGHHRSAAASRVAAQRKADNPMHDGEESYNYFLTAIFPHKQMQILDYNRVLRDLNGLSADEFLQSLSPAFEVTPSERPVKPALSAEFGLYLEARWYCLNLDPARIPAHDPVGRLEVSLLTDNLIRPILGIEDQRRDTRIDFVGGIRGLEGLEARVNSGDMRLALSLYPTSMESLMAVADAGEVMPPKSTWFEPKLADGLVSHVLD